VLPNAQSRRPSRLFFYASKGCLRKVDSKLHLVPLSQEEILAHVCAPVALRIRVLILMMILMIRLIRAWRQRDSAAELVDCKREQ
jgi:hypothetical protein